MYIWWEDKKILKNVIHSEFNRRRLEKLGEPGPLLPRVGHREVCFSRSIHSLLFVSLFRFPYPFLLFYCSVSNLFLAFSFRSLLSLHSHLLLFFSSTPVLFQWVLRFFQCIWFNFFRWFSICRWIFSLNFFFFSFWGFDMCAYLVSGNAHVPILGLSCATLQALCVQGVYIKSTLSFGLFVEQNLNFFWVVFDLALWFAFLFISGNVCLCF